MAAALLQSQIACPWWSWFGFSHLCFLNGCTKPKDPEGPVSFDPCPLKWKPQLCFHSECAAHTKKATYKNTRCLAVLLARIYSASSCRWRGVKKQANSCHAECHFDSNALGGHKKNAHSRRHALMTAAAALCFACYTNVPSTFPFCSNAKLSSGPTLLVLLFSHFFFLPLACTLFTLKLTKKKGRRERMCTDCRDGPAAAQRERQMQNPLGLMQLT